MLGKLSRMLDPHDLGAEIGGDPARIGARRKREKSTIRRPSSADMDLLRPRGGPLAAGPSMKSVIEAATASASSPSRLKLSTLSSSTECRLREGRGRRTDRRRAGATAASTWWVWASWTFQGAPRSAS
jgi:hypothetical protein